MSRGKKKIYGIALAVALVGLLMDRFVLDQPQLASAALSQVFPKKNSNEKAGKLAKNEPKKAEEILFPVNMLPMDWSANIHSPFALPAKIAERRDLRLTGGISEAGVPAARKPGEPLTVVQFVKLHRLKGIMVGNPTVAIVDDQAVEVGKKFDESLLLRVEGAKAYFQCLDGVAVMSIAGTE